MAVRGIGGYGAPQTGLLQDRQDNFFGGPWIGGTLQHDEMARTQVRADGRRRVLNVGKIGLAVLVKGRGDANQAGVHGLEGAEIVGGLEMLLFDGLGDGGLGDVSNVCLPTPKLLDLGGIDVEAGARESPAR